MRLIHLTKLQQFAADNGITLFHEAVIVIFDYMDSMIDAENDTRFSVGGYAAAMLPSATKKDVEWFLEHYTPASEIPTPENREDLPF